MEIKTRRITEVPVLDKATENTNLLVEENGVSRRLPAPSFGAMCAESVSAELGTVKEVFHIDYDGKDEYEDGKFDYAINIIPVDAQNIQLLGKTLCVKTYADSDMFCRLNKTNWNSGDGPEEQIQVNPNADIAHNPESGICEFEITIPEILDDEDSSYDEFNIFIPFAENPYIEDAEIWEKKDTVWSEIAKVSNNGIIASGCDSTCYWRKWGDGFAECWMDIDSEAVYMEGAEAYINILLPFPFCPDHKLRIVANVAGDATDENDMRVYSVAMPTSAQFMDGTNVEVYLQVPHSEIVGIFGTMYVTGYWKYKEEAMQ